MNTFAGRLPSNSIPVKNNVISSYNILPISHLHRKKLALSFKAFNTFFLSSLSFLPLLPASWTTLLLIHILFLALLLFLWPFFQLACVPPWSPFTCGPFHPVLPLYPTLRHHTVRLLHSLGIWMTVSCGAFCLCWPALASSSCSSRLSFFLPVSLSTSHCVIFSTTSSYYDFFCDLTSFSFKSKPSFPCLPVIVPSSYFSFIFCLVAHY